MILCNVCTKQMRSDTLKRHRCLAIGHSKNLTNCICSRQMRADNLQRHQKSCAVFLSHQENNSSCAVESLSSSSSSKNSFRKAPNDPKRVFKEVVEYKSLTFEDKLVAAKSIKRMSSTLRNIESARTERLLVFSRTKCLEHPTAVQQCVLKILNNYLHRSLDTHCPIIILVDRPGQSGKSSLAKSLMHCSETRSPIPGLQLPTTYNFFFLYLRNLNVEQCSSAISYEELLPHDENRRFILWLDVTRNFRLPPGKLESIHDGLLDVGSLVKDSLHLVQPFFVVVSCNESRQIQGTLSTGRYSIHDLRAESREFEQQQEQSPRAVAYTVKRKISNYKTTAAAIEKNYKQIDAAHKEELQHRVHILQDRVANSELTDEQKLYSEYKLKHLKGILMLDEQVRDIRSSSASNL